MDGTASGKWLIVVQEHTMPDMSTSGGRTALWQKRPTHPPLEFLLSPASGRQASAPYSTAIASPDSPQVSSPGSGLSIPPSFAIPNFAGHAAHASPAGTAVCWRSAGSANLAIRRGTT